MAEMAETILALYKIIPEYVLGSLPVIAIMGDSPYRVLDALLMDSFTPSTLEYTNNEEETNDKEITKGTDRHPKYRPFGFHAMKLNIEKNKIIKEYVVLCTAKASVLERLSSLVSAYYIMIGLTARFSMVQGKIVCEVKDPSDVFDKIQIIVDNDPKDKLKFHKCVTITIINSLSLDDSTYRLLYTP
ncbi:7245_t:CDS:2, partial [Funneliformis caledonium]